MGSNQQQDAEELFHLLMETIVREINERRRPHGDRMSLGSLLKTQGRHEEAEPLHRFALAGREEELGDSHPETLSSVNNLANLL